MSDERPDAAGIRPLKAAVHEGKVYLDLSSFTEGFRARADAVEEQGYHDVAQLYRREADELDTAAIGWLTDADPPRLPLPRVISGVTSMLSAQLVGESLSENEDVKLPLTLPDGSQLLVDIHVYHPQW